MVALMIPSRNDASATVAPACGNKKRSGRMSSLLNKNCLTIKRCLVVLAVFALGILPARALESIKLPEPPDTVAFNIQKNGESTPITLRQLEKLGLYKITTPSPFESGQLT